jgi:hypothetical protein
MKNKEANIGTQSNELNVYGLSRSWFDWCFENPDLITPNHTALYFFCIEHCNRLGWKQKFGLPTTMAKEAIGIHSYNTYIKTLNDLIAFGFIKLIEKSKNQYSSNIIALSYNNKALDKALDKAFINHTSKQRESTSESSSSIDIQDTNLQDNNSTNLQNKNKLLSELKSSDVVNVEYLEYTLSFWNLFKKNLIEAGTSTKKLDRAKSSWVDDMRKLIETDKKTPQELKIVFEFLQKNDFWKKNIQSISKLREKFDTLILNAKNDTKKPTSSNSNDDRRDKLQQLQQNALDVLKYASNS